MVVVLRRWNILLLVVSYLDLLWDIGDEGIFATNVMISHSKLFNFQFVWDIIHSAPAYEVVISQLIRYAAVCRSYMDILQLAQYLALTSKLLNWVTLPYTSKGFTSGTMNFTMRRDLFTMSWLLLSIVAWFEHYMSNVNSVKDFRKVENTYPTSAHEFVGHVLVYSVLNFSFCMHFSLMCVFYGVEQVFFV